MGEIRCGNVKPHDDESEIGQSGKLGNPTLQETTSSLMEKLDSQKDPIPRFGKSLETTTSCETTVRCKQLKM